MAQDFSVTFYKPTKIKFACQSESLPGIGQKYGLINFGFVFLQFHKFKVEFRPNDDLGT